MRQLMWMLFLLPFMCMGQTYRYVYLATRLSAEVPENNLKMTPGDVSGMTKEQLCQKGFHTGEVRNVDRVEKLQVCFEYGIPASECTGKKFEIDHLIPLELGGSNSIRNLWPQPYVPVPGAHQKDKLENWLHKEVCTGKIPLDKAQKVISEDWYTEWYKMKEHIPAE